MSDIENLEQQLADIVPPTVHLDEDMSATIKIGTESVTIPEPFVAVIAASLYGLSLARCNLLTEPDRSEYLMQFEARITHDVADWMNVLRRATS